MTTRDKAGRGGDRPNPNCFGRGASNVSECECLRIFKERVSGTRPFGLLQLRAQAGSGWRSDTLLYGLESMPKSESNT